MSNASKKEKVGPSPGQGGLPLTNEQCLLDAMEGLDLPDSRKEISKPNLMWLLRNIRVRNASHPDLNQIISLIRVVMRTDG